MRQKSRLGKTLLPRYELSREKIEYNFVIATWGILRYQAGEVHKAEERDRWVLGGIIPSSQKREAEIGGIFKRKITSVADLHGMAMSRVASLFSLCHSDSQYENRKEQKEQWWFQKQIIATKLKKTKTVRKENISRAVRGQARTSRKSALCEERLSSGNIGFVWSN